MQNGFWDLPLFQTSFQTKNFAKKICTASSTAATTTEGFPDFATSAKKTQKRQE